MLFSHNNEYKNAFTFSHLTVPLSPSLAGENRKPGEESQMHHTPVHWQPLPLDNWPVGSVLSSLSEENLYDNTNTVIKESEERMRARLTELLVLSPNLESRLIMEEIRVKCWPSNCGQVWKWKWMKNIQSQQCTAWASFPFSYQDSFRSSICLHHKDRVMQLPSWSLSLHFNLTSKHFNAVIRLFWTNLGTVSVCLPF